ncbi:MAG: hypothetical protein ACK56F_09640, partial [bacterium]
LRDNRRPYPDAEPYEAQQCTPIGLHCHHRNQPLKASACRSCRGSRARQPSNQLSRQNGRHPYGDR